MIRAVIRNDSHKQVCGVSDREFVDNSGEVVLRVVAEIIEFECDQRLSFPWHTRFDERDDQLKAIYSYIVKCISTIESV